MKDTAEQSAELKMSLKHDGVSRLLCDEAAAFPLEAAEALDEAETGLDPATTGSWVAEQLEAAKSQEAPE